MKNTETSQYLAVALQSLEKVLLPELSSADAKATAEIMKLVLGELIKREHYTPRLLEEHIAEGQVLAERMVALQKELGLAASDPALDTPAASACTREAGFAALADQHAAQTDRITHLAHALASQRDQISDPTQQDYLSTLLHKAAAWEHAYYSAQREAAVNMAPLRGSTPGAPLTQEALQAFLRGVHPAADQCSVATFTSIPGGFGKQTFRAGLTDGSGAVQSVIARKSDPIPMLLYGGFFIDREFHLLKDIHATGFPVAEPLFLGAGVPGVDADFYVMSALQGAVPSSFLGAASAVVPESVLLHLAELMARLHRLELQHFTPYLKRFGEIGLLEDTVETCYRRCLAEWRDYYSKGGHLPSPYLTYLLDWLERHVPQDSQTPVLVHGDFNIHNVLAQDGRITGVLDWECAMFGAPEQDLAYIKPVISKHIGWDRFMAHYLASGGRPINEQSLNFYMAFSAMRVSIAFNKGVRNLQEGYTRDIRYAVIELGLTPEFMNMAMSSTSAPESPAPLSV
jgi:aminoglycoside phosphotransferase (APT) family kinase protein